MDKLMSFSGVKPVSMLWRLNDVRRHACHSRSSATSELEVQIPSRFLPRPLSLAQNRVICRRLFRCPESSHSALVISFHAGLWAGIRMPPAQTDHLSSHPQARDYLRLLRESTGVQERFLFVSAEWRGKIPQRLSPYDAEAFCT